MPLMRSLVLYALCTGTLIPAVAAQDRGASDPPLVVGAVIPFVHVRIDVPAAARSFYVPLCGEGTFGGPVLCGSGAHLQVQIRGQWRQARLRTTFGVLGAEKMDRVPGRLVEEKSKISLLFQFSSRWYDVNPGQLLRVLVDTWRDEQSFRNHEPPNQLATPVFRCPVTGMGTDP